LKALGGCLWYLKYNLLDLQVLSVANFTLHTPPDEKDSSIREKNKSPSQKFMILDAITLQNLNVNLRENSLFTKIDFCCTAWGKRLLMDILCNPSAEIEEIKQRQQAVKELYENIELLTNCRSLLSSLNVDLDRSLAQINQLGNKEMIKNHPSGRAILYEAATYGKNKIADFTAALNALEESMKISSIFEDCQSEMLKNLTQKLEVGGQFEDMSEEIKSLKKSFDIDEAKKTGFIIPERNVDDEYDQILNAIDELDEEIKAYLKQQEKKVGCKLTFQGTDRKRYQIEVPASHSTKIPSTYDLESSKGKGKNATSRYTTQETKEFLAKMMELENQKKEFLDDFGRRVFEKFSKNFSKYKKVVSLLGKLDVLAALAEYARNLNECCVPEIFEMVKNSGECFIKITNGVHPLMSANDYIPNGNNNFEELTNS
jgi:DNA mismatch repair protein MSH6